MNYYNEFDPKAAAWLRELIVEGLIPPGDVDERSITNVRADELLGYTQCHFFAGIGGWSLALRLIGWPDDRPVWTGSCPCQAFSTAGKQRGFDDERDLWPVFANLITECRPKYVFGEQVENAIRHGWLDRVYADLEREGYAVGAHVLGAHSVVSPHRRQRLYWGAASVADSDSKRCKRESISAISRRGNCAEANRCGDALSVADNADGRRCGGRDEGDQAGRGREVQAPRLGNDGGMADDTILGGTAGVSGSIARKEGNTGEPVNDSLSNLPWLNSRFIYCRDKDKFGNHKIRRIPAESLLFGLADGVSEGMDGSGVVGVSEDDGFPLTTQKEGRVMLLKGYGNAIVPQVAAEFVGAFMEASR